MQNLLAWTMNNYMEVFAILGMLVAAAEAIVRLTPTKKDDGAVERVGNILRRIMDFLKIPKNIKK